MDYSLYIAVALYFLVAATGWALTWLNLKHLEVFGAGVPPGFEGHLDALLLARIRDYTAQQARLGLFESVFGSALAAVFIVFFLRPYDEWLASFGFGFIAHGVVFFMLLIYAEALLSVPFSLYSAFGVEKKYGFSNMTPGLWLSDRGKALLVTTVLSAVLIGAALWIIKASPGLWWFWLWGFFFAFTLFMMYLSPYVIEPLFNRFDELDDPELKEAIREVLAKAGITVAKVQKVDASRRSSHTNAYFTGIGSVKRIVLYDTLMERLDRDELISVLAHETGHWKGKHLLKGIALMEALALVVLYASYKVLESGVFETIFNMPGASFFAQAVMLGFLGTIAAFPFTPFFAWLSRRREREADRSAIELGKNPEAYSRALVKLSKDNLSNLHPHPLYAAFYYSHPLVVERVAEIRKMGG